MTSEETRFHIYRGFFWMTVGMIALGMLTGGIDL